MRSGTSRSCLIVSETYLPLFGGAELYTYNFAKQLVDRGYTVTILTHSAGTIPAPYALPQVKIIVLAKFSKRAFWKLPALLRQLNHVARQHDLLFANYTYALSTILAITARFQRKPVTVFAHGLGTIIDATHPRIYRVYRYITLKLATSVITTSEEIADIVRLFTKRVLVATAVDFAAIQAYASKPLTMPVAEGSKFILTVRRLVEKNGIQFLIEAIPHLLKLRTDFIYLVIGDGRMRPELEARVHELGIGNHVKFLGEIQNAEVFPYIAHAQTVVFPSSAEALSLAAIECMYLGTPVVASAIGGLLELIGEKEERGTLIDLFGRSTSVYTAPDAHSLTEETYVRFAHVLNTVLAHGPEIDRKAAAAKTYVAERFDWPKVADDILSFIRAPKAYGE